VLSKRYHSSTSVPADGPHFFGTPEDCRQNLKVFVDIGVTHFVFNMTCYPEEALSQLEVFARKILPSR
ncbi:MAG: hypothetical protein ACE5JL_06890, partial [Dehalococcoidia bacterium]